MQMRHAQQRRQAGGRGAIGTDGGGNGINRRLAAGSVGVQHLVFPDHPAAGWNRKCLFLAGRSCEFNVLSEVDLDRARCGW